MLMPANSRSVTNTELKMIMADMLAELKAIPRMDQRLGGIEGHLKTLNGTVRENRENIIRLQNTDSVLTDCLNRLESRQAQHEQLHAEQQKTAASRWWDLAKIPLGVGIGAFLTWVMSGGLRLP